MLGGILRILDARLCVGQILLAGPEGAVASIMLGMIMSVCPQLLPSSMSLLQAGDRRLQCVSSTWSWRSQLSSSVGLPSCSGSCVYSSRHEYAADDAATRT